MTYRLVGNHPTHCATMLGEQFMEETIHEFIIYFDK